MTQTETFAMDERKLPRHIAMIMDGNGRWAKMRNLPRVMGHKKGTETVRMVIRCCAEWGIPNLTLYAFSQENWKRPRLEVDFLMNLLEGFLENERAELMREGVRFLTIGDTEVLSEPIKKKIRQMKEETASNRRLNLTIALNYGSRQEILEAVRKVLREAAADPAGPAGAAARLDEKEFERHLDTAGTPDPDLLIRTSGELRLSNFLLWQCSYSEFYSSSKFWPDFSREDFRLAIEDYGERQRRFGGVS